MRLSIRSSRLRQFDASKACAASAPSGSLASAVGLHAPRRANILKGLDWSSEGKQRIVSLNWRPPRQRTARVHRRETTIRPQHLPEVNRPRRRSRESVGFTGESQSIPFEWVKMLRRSPKKSSVTSPLAHSEVSVTLEIDAMLPDGAADQTVRTVTENCRT